ncbi:MAG TPA: sulfite exporter TauE/SafE family protein [Anaerolineales bacterium]|nr:sulfite exporter TauE/SafE family protein [Anaerolineales bacterium]
MSKERKPALDPVILMALGIGLLTIAIIMLVTQNQGEQGISIGAGSGFTGNIMVAFITGLTTGGLSCLAVQGGLLASSLAHQIEQDYLEQSAGQKKKHLKRHQVEVARSSTAQPILLFLASKIVAYTLLGALLGWLGSFLALNPITRAVLMIAIGMFMVGNALRMFNVHPIFRYFSIEPPKFITRYIRKTAKGTDAVTPIFLGLLTVFIPCGVTQAMMATALGTGSVFMGAALMLAFTLGTSPVFFIVAYLTTEFGARLEKFFMRFVAAVVLVLGLVTLDGGLNLMGFPYSLTNLARGLTNTASISETSASAPSSDLTLMVENDGYFPQTLTATANQPVVLNLVTDKTYSCSRDFVIPDLNFYQLLPDTGTVQVDIPAQPAGTRMFFTCSMGMYTGTIIFE